MKMYIAKVGSQAHLDKGNSYSYWSDPMDTRKEARKWAEKQFENSQNHQLPEHRYDVFVVEEVEVNFTDDESIAKREGYKPFWLNIYEESKYVKLFWAKDKGSLESDMASEMIQEDFSESGYGELTGWCWKNGSTDWEIHEDTSQEVA